MSKFILIQDNIFGFYEEALPKVSLIAEDSRERAVELAEFVGVDFEDYCECCGSRWFLGEYDAEFHSYLGDNIPDLAEWVLEKSGN